MGVLPQTGRTLWVVAPLWCLMSGVWANIFKMVRLELPIMAHHDSKHTSVSPIIHVLNCNTSACGSSVDEALYKDANLVGAWCKSAH
jgi:hypothetical protein